MSRITKSITFDDELDGDLLAWIQTRIHQSARPGERPDFSRFVRSSLYEAFERGTDITTNDAPSEHLLSDIRAVVEAAVSNALANANLNITAAGSLIDADDDDDDFSGLILD